MDTSGTSRQAVSALPAAASLRQKRYDRPLSALSTFSAEAIAVLLSIPGTRELSCHDGIGHDDEMPPPPPPPFCPSFHTCSTGGFVASSIVTPPAPTTYGWLAGSSTESSGETGWARKSVSQSSEPSSPPAAKTDWPCAAACSKISFSIACTPGEPCWRACSQSPQLVETIFAVSSSTILA